MTEPTAPADEHGSPVPTLFARTLGFFPPRQPGAAHPGGNQIRRGIADILLLGARLYAGIWMTTAGLGKLPTPDWMIDQVVQVGFPMPHFFAYCASMSEFVGGVLLTFGLLTRPAALFMAFTMAVAAFGFHKVDPITEFHITQSFLWLYVAFLAVGPGRLSLDFIISVISGRKPMRYVVVAILLAFPVFAYGTYLELATDWQPPVEEASSNETIGIAGPFNEWSPSANPMTKEVAPDGTVWSIDLELPEGPLQFKFTTNNTWDVNLGDADQPDARFPLTGTGEIGAGDIEAYIPAAGTYRVTLDTEGFVYSLEAVGGATDAGTPASP
ncbi:MAG: DoxX family membrane protein [Planctomycetota bacterium]